MPIQLPEPNNPKFLFMNKSLHSIISLAALGVASTASAQLVVTATNTPTVITFDANTPGIYQARTGTGGTRSIAEPGSWDIDPSNSNKASALISTGVALSQSFHTGYQGQGQGSPTRFAADGNGNGSTNDVDIGFSSMAVFQVSGLTSNALRLSANADWALNGLYFRIQNNTGATVSSWTFTADLFIEEPDADGFSNVQFSYAVNNGNNPAAMTFTAFGGSPTITQGMTLSANPQFQLNATVSATVAQGDYIILAFNDISQSSGSTVFIDNIGITAVPEPSTYALLGGLVALGLAIVRRRKE